MRFSTCHLEYTGRVDPENFPSQVGSFSARSRQCINCYIPTIPPVERAGLSFMVKLMLSIRNESFQRISSEAMERGVTVQELLRAVIVPEWVRENKKPALGPV